MEEKWQHERKYSLSDLSPKLNDSSNGDGIGDLKNYRKLDYLKNYG